MGRGWEVFRVLAAYWQKNTSFLRDSKERAWALRPEEEYDLAYCSPLLPILFAKLIELLLSRSEILEGSSKLGVANISAKQSKAWSVLRSRKPVDIRSCS